MNLYFIRPFHLLLSLGMVLLPLFSARALDPGEPEPSSALVRIDPGGEQVVGELAGLDLTLFERMYTAQGDPFLIAAAGSETQRILTERGFKVVILDPQIAEQGYQLLYGSPQALESARLISRLLLVEGNQAVAQAEPEHLSALIALGLDFAPLVPRPLIAAAEPARAALLPSAITPIPLVQQMVSQLTTADLYNLVGSLSGEWSVTINDAPYTIETRYTYTATPITKATRYAYEFFASLGLETGYDYYYISGAEKRSVIAQQRGVTDPDKIFLLVAHLDSTSHVNGNPYVYAPGADDNASGSAALMRIAQILSQYRFGCTLRYALFTGEEQGYYGSQAYAADIYNQRENLQAVLNLDMLGYSTPGSAPRIELHTRPQNVNDLAIAYLFRDAVSAYGLQLTPLILQDGKSFSDHSSFWYYNYPAIMAIEDWDDHTPYYHMTGDQLETLNLAYYTEFAKAALATFAHMGCLLEGEVSGTVTDQVSGLPIAGASVEAWQNGIQVDDTSTLADGNYQLPLQPGSYSIWFRAQDYLAKEYPNINILQNQTHQLDASLTPCIFVRDTQAQTSNLSPEIGETVYFTATISGGALPVTYEWDFGDGSTATGAQVNHAFAERGSYVVSLTANNPCGVPGRAGTVAYVDVSLTLLPIAQNP